MKTDRKEYKRQWYLKNRPARLEATRQQRQELYEWFRNLKKTLKCQKCGFAHPAALDFHHRDGGEKDAEVTRLVASKVNKTRILEEIAKCDVLCANCHRIIHHEMIYGSEAQVGG